jgi:hypothetical protein
MCYFKYLPSKEGIVKHRKFYQNRHLKWILFYGGTNISGKEENSKST